MNIYIESWNNAIQVSYRNSETCICLQNIHELILKFSDVVFIVNLKITNFQKHYFKLVFGYAKAGDPFNLSIFMHENIFLLQ